ncbi:MAG: hypothetical protein AAB263_21345 [Planctomycetota bacterium]
MIRGVLAVAGLTWREGWRGRLWLVPLAAIALLIIIAPSVDAAEPGGAMRLIIAASSIAAGFCAVLLAALVPAAQMTRDIEGRIALTVLPKPLPRIGWLLGRWLGTMAICAAVALLISTAGSAIVTWRTGQVQTSRAVQRADSFMRLSGLGESVQVAGGFVRLAGPAGDGVRWTFHGLQPSSTAYEVLLRAQIHQRDSGNTMPVPIRAAAIGMDGSVLPLLLDPASPYGRTPMDASMNGANCWLADRSPERNSLGSDWARLRIPAGAISDAGQLVIRMTRLDPLSTIAVTEAGCAVAVPAGAQPLHAALATLAELAAPAVIAAAALAVATIGSLPIALLAALTLAFAGNVLWAVREVLSWGELSRPVARMLELCMTCVPDFHATGQGVLLAAGEAVTMQHIAAAWSGILPHLLVLLALGWWALARRQL